MKQHEGYQQNILFFYVPVASQSNPYKNIFSFSTIIKKTTLRNVTHKQKHASRKYYLWKYIFNKIFRLIYGSFHYVVSWFHFIKSKTVGKMCDVILRCMFKTLEIFHIVHIWHRDKPELDMKFYLQIWAKCNGKWNLLWSFSVLVHDILCILFIFLYSLKLKMFV